MRIKICGITCIEDALLAYNLGAWAIGFNFYPASPRYIHPEAAHRISEQLPENLLRIGICIDADLQFLKEVSSITHLDFIQSHDAITENACNHLHTPFIKVFRFRDESDLPQINTYNHSDYVLIDSYSPNCLGGSGILANLELSKHAQAQRNIILAGGLNAENVRHAVEYVNPFAIDLCSGVELRPGKKCEQKMRNFFNIIKEIQL